MSNLRLSYLQKVGGRGYLYRPSPPPKKVGGYIPPIPPGIYASAPYRRTKEIYECELMKADPVNVIQTIS